MFTRKGLFQAAVMTVVLGLLAIPQPAHAFSADGSDIRDGSECYEFAGGQMCFVGDTGGNSQPPYQGGEGWKGQPPYRAPAAGTYVVRWGDTMRIIADRHGVSLWSLIAANPQIWNPNIIYAGQVIYLPTYAGQPPYYQHDRGWPPREQRPWGWKPGYGEQEPKPTNLYTIQRGDTLKSIAKKFNTTVADLLTLNPSLKGKANRIHVGLEIRLW